MLDIRLEDAIIPGVLLAGYHFLYTKKKVDDLESKDKDIEKAAASLLEVAKANQISITSIATKAADLEKRVKPLEDWRKVVEDPPTEAGRRASYYKYRAPQTQNDAVFYTSREN